MTSTEIIEEVKKAKRANPEMGLEHCVAICYIRLTEAFRKGLMEQITDQFYVDTMAQIGSAYIYLKINKDELKVDKDD